MKTYLLVYICETSYMYDYVYTQYTIIVNNSKLTWIIIIIRKININIVDRYNNYWLICYYFHETATVISFIRKHKILLYFVDVNSSQITISIIYNWIELNWIMFINKHYLITKKNIKKENIFRTFKYIY